MRTWAVIVFLGIFVVGCGRGGSLVQEGPAKSQGKPSESSERPTTTDTASPDPSPGGSQVAPVNASAGTNSEVTAVANPPDAAVDKVEVIGFDDLNIGMPADARFRSLMLEYNDGRAKALLGRVVNIGGYMNPPDQLRGLTEFVLLKNTSCKFGPGGQADHLARVYLKEGTTIDYTDKVIYVEGRITLKPFPDDSPMTWSIYDIEATNISTRAPSRGR